MPERQAAGNGWAAPDRAGMLERNDFGGDAPPPLTPPRRYLVRMAVFLVLVGFIAFILYRTLWAAFMANPGLNGLIVAVTLIGVILAVRQVWRLFPEVRWVNDLSNETLLPPDAPRLLAPIAGLIASRANRSSLSVGTIRSLLDAIAARLDESRELLRYLAGLLVFLGFSVRPRRVADRRLSRTAGRAGADALLHGA